MTALSIEDKARIVRAYADWQKTIRFIQMGLSWMYAKFCKTALEKEGIEIVGAVRRLILAWMLMRSSGLGKACMILIDDISTPAATKLDVVLHSMLSSPELIKEQLISIIKGGIDIVSTCEELSCLRKTRTDIDKELVTLTTWPEFAKLLAING